MPSYGFVSTAIAILVSRVPAATFAGTVVITTPSGQSTIVQTDGVASHVISDYSAQIHDVFADPDEHVVTTTNNTQTSESSGRTATVTVVNN
ncbi:MAG: hypothetical protein ACYC75_00580 [Minisyncoccota bacterium]